MGRVIRYALGSMVLLVMVNCASSPGSTPANTQLTRVGEAVQVTENGMAARDCEYVADLPVESRLDENDMRVLRNEAGIQGANLVLLLRETTGDVLRAEGYLCAD